MTNQPDATDQDEQPTPTVANLKSGAATDDQGRHRQPLYPEHWTRR
ncbi:hypothetical protein [Mycolicibacterium elephantis]|nr:hypothetical protein [Mycolicibacterium elephantis]MCV7219845.1 hypothetical protein [Mycolicibacterium elephantis]